VVAPALPAWARAWLLPRAVAALHAVVRSPCVARLVQSQRPGEYWHATPSGRVPVLLVLAGADELHAPYAPPGDAAQDARLMAPFAHPASHGAWLLGAGHALTAGPAVGPVADAIAAFVGSRDGARGGGRVRVAAWALRRVLARADMRWQPMRRGPVAPAAKL
jgi:hypothetical protein